MAKVTVDIVKASEKGLIKTLREGMLQAVAETMYAATGDVKKLYDKYTPKKTGNLRKNAEVGVRVDNATASATLYVKYKQPYARYQYINHFQHYTTPGTDGEWNIYSENNVRNEIYSIFMKKAKGEFR